jgi:hypothetical protein
MGFCAGKHGSEKPYQRTSSDDDEHCREEEDNNDHAGNDEKRSQHTAAGRARHRKLDLHPFSSSMFPGSNIRNSSV